MVDSYPVKLYVYDLSKGMAKAMSMQLTGRQIDGIWHTSVVVYGREYYFGQGIMEDEPGTTHHGLPQEQVDMGSTSLPHDVLLDFLEEIKGRYQPEHYNLLEHNCNTFTNEVVQFLTGASIPSHITSLPSDFLSTPFGQSIAPMLRNAFGPDRARSSAPAPTLAAAAAASSPLPPSSSPSTVKSPHPSLQLLHTIQSEDQMVKLIEGHRAIVIYFTSQGCPPCRLIHPEFDALIQGQAEQGLKDRPVIGLTLDLSSSGAYSAGAKWAVRGTPTFVFLLNGKEEHRFSGANRAELVTQIEILRNMAYPPHWHSRLRLSSLSSLPPQPILFSSTSLSPKSIGEKSKELASDFLNDTDFACIDSLVHYLELKDTENPEFPLSQVNVFVTILEKIPAESIFPLLDLLRLILLSSPPSTKTSLYEATFWLSLLTHVSPTEAQRPTILLVLRCLCNTFSLNHFPAPESHPIPLVLQDSGSSAYPGKSLREEVTQYVVETLLSQDKGIREAASSLGFNVSQAIRNDLEAHGNGGSLQNEDWHTELVSAAITALEAEMAPRVIHRLTGMLGRLLHQAAPEILELAQVLGLVGILEEKEALEGMGSSEKALVKDVKALVEESASQ